MEIYLNILLPLPFNQGFTYKTALQGIEIGDLVKVEFRKKPLWGLVLESSEAPSNIDPKKIKEVLLKHETLKFQPHHINFLNRIAAYNLAPKGLVLKAFIGVLNSDKVKNPLLANKALRQEVDLEKFTLKKLSEKQQLIVDDILKRIVAKKLEPLPNINLIDAVTGSGKTEIYFAVIAEILKQKDSQILIMLPEIALTSQLLTRFESQFGFKPALWHSKITAKDKREIFNGIIDGSVRALIGARSALLLPFKNLQLIIIDEEHDSSYKQDEVFNFNARDMAVMKATIEKFCVILSSATPSLESFHNAKSGKYHYYHLGEKFNQKNNAINVIDLRQQKLEKGSYISQPLRDALVKNFELRQQSLLFLNRRGYAPVTLCKACGQKVNCLNCSSYLVHHKHAKTAVCHYCGHHEIFSHDCRSCGEKNVIINIGAGVEKIKEEIESLFPQARIACVTSDDITNFKEADELVRKISAQEIDIIIGTQIIAKGYDFPNLTMVGVVDADSGFYSSELRSGEKSFQLLSQVIGRAGRSDYQGRVYIQTYNPQNFIFEKIIKNDKIGFFEYEIQNRKTMNMPPFSKMACFTISHFDEAMSQKAAKQLVAAFPFNDAVEIFGPSPAIMPRLKNRYYYRIFLKTDKKINLQKLILDVINDCDFLEKVRLKIDIDPQ